MTDPTKWTDEYLKRKIAANAALANYYFKIGQQNHDRLAALLKEKQRRDAAKENPVPDGL